MFIAKFNNLIIECAEKENMLMQKLKGRIYTSIEETEDTYVMYNGMIITEAKAEEKQEQAEQARKAKLKMTKRDFFLYVLQPYGVTYQALNQALSSDDTLAACFNLCNHIYRYDSMLVGNIKTLLETLTQQSIDEDELMAFLDVQFETHNATD